MKILYFCSFYGRQFLRQQPVALVALLSSLGLAIFAGVLFADSASESGLTNELLRRQLELPLTSKIQAAESTLEAKDLPAFSSAAFTSQLLSVASDMHIPTEELTYTLETGSTQPYWRYRIALNVKAGYPELRKFIAALSHELPNVVLDAIRCRREDVAIGQLSCQLAFSAFFRAENHG